MITIDETDFLAGYRNLQDSDISDLQQTIASDVAWVVYESIQDHVRRDLSPTTAAKYLMALQPPERTPDGVQIVLRDDTEAGPLPIWLEQGVESFKMWKPEDEEIPITVPFGHGGMTETPLGMQRGGPPWVMSPHRTPRALLSEKRRRQAEMGFPEKMRTPTRHQRRRLARGLMQAATHRYDIREHFRLHKPEHRSKSAFVTFRTKPSMMPDPHSLLNFIAAREGRQPEELIPDPNAWIHPGLSARRYMERNLALNKPQIKRIINQYMQVFGP